MGHKAGCGKNACLKRIGGGNGKNKRQALKLLMHTLYIVQKRRESFPLN